MVPIALIVAVLAQTPAPGAPVQRPAPSSWQATDLEMLADERDSLRGISRLAVSLAMPENAPSDLAWDALLATVTFRLEQAGVVVVGNREVEDPLLAIRIHTTRGPASGANEWVAYRISADLMQLVRLKDDGGQARFTLASTWQTASHGVTAASGGDLRSRVMALVDAFLADLASRRPSTPTPARPAIP